MNKIAELKNEVGKRQAQIEQLRLEIKTLNEELTEEIQLHEHDQRQLVHVTNQERGLKWETEDPEGHKAFIEEIRERNRQGILNGAKQGWWEIDENGNMLAPPIIVNSAELPNNALMAHVMAKAGIFPSVNQAKKNGWDKPLTKGEFTVTKKKIRIRVV